MKLGMLFPGYGSQFVGMGKDIYDSSRVVQEYFEEASNCADINFVKLCFASSDAELSLIQNAYLALFLTTVSTAAAIKEIGFEIDIIAGYGVGEIAAICAAKGLSFPDGIYLLTKISQFYSELIVGLDLKSVLVVGLNLKELKKICNDINTETSFAEIVGFNSDTEFIITGHSQAVDQIIIEAKKQRAKCINQSIDAGLYSKLAEPIVSNIAMYLGKIDFKNTTCPVVFGSDAKLISDAKEIKKRVIKHVISPILWNKVLAQFADCDILLIPTPGKDLMQKVQEYYPDKKVFLVATPQDIDNLKIIFDENNKKVEID